MDPKAANSDAYSGSGPNSSALKGNSSAHDSEVETIFVESTVSKTDANSGSGRSFVSIVSDDGGFASGEEEFENAPERPLLDDPDEENLDKVVVTENSNGPSPGSVEIGKISDGVIETGDESRVVETGENGGVLDGEKGFGGDDEVELEKDSGRVGDSGGEDSVVGNGTSDSVVVDGNESVVNGKLEVSAFLDGGGLKAHSGVEEAKEEFLDGGGLKVDSVVEEVKDGSGEVKDDNPEDLKVGKDVNSNEGVGSKSEGSSVLEEERVELTNVNGEGGRKDEVVEAVNDESELVNREVIESPKSGMVEIGGVKFTSEGDAVVDAIQVNLSLSGVAMVGETVENGDSKHALGDDGVPLVESSGETSNVVVELTDAFKVQEVAGVVEDGAVPTSDAHQLNSETVEEEKEKPDLVNVHGAKFTAEEDAVGDSIQVNMSEPGVAVVGEKEENEDLKLQSEEASHDADGSDESSHIVQETPDDSVIRDRNAEPITNSDLVGAESTLKADDDEKLDAEVAKSSEAEPAEKNLLEDDKAEDSATVEVNNIAKSRNVESEHEAIEAKHSNGDFAHGIVLDDGLKDVEEIAESPHQAQDEMEEVRDVAGSVSDEETDGMIFGSSEAARKFIEELERGSGDSSADTSRDHPQMIDGEIASDSDEEVDTDEEGDGKEYFDSSALAALLKAATGADSDSGGNITITSQDGSRHFTLERPAGLGSSLRSLRPAPQPNRLNPFAASSLSRSGESESNLSAEEKKKLENLQEIRVKFLRLVQRLGLSRDEPVAARVLYQLALLAGRQNNQLFSLEDAKRAAAQLEAEGKGLDFSVKILVLGKSGVGKSATINAILGEDKALIDAFEPATTNVKEISSVVDGVKVQIFDTPGLKSSVMEQAFNRKVLSSVKSFTKKNSADIVLYVDRLDAQTRDLNDLPLLRTITGSLGPSIWRSAIVTLTHGASAPPDGPSGSPLSYEVFVTQRSHVVQQSIGQAVGDLRMMSPSLMNPVSLVENHPSCRKNREGQKILPNGQVWRSQLLLLCYSMKILSEANAHSKPQDPFDHRKLFGFRVRSPPLPYMLSSMLQSRPHPKLTTDQGGENGDSDVDLSDLSDSDQEEDEYDQLPPFRPLRKAQLAKLSREQRKAYFEEYDYRVKLLQKKQWREELRRMKEMKKKGKDVAVDYGFPEEDVDSGAAAPVAVPLPDMALPPSFDSDNPAYRYRFLEPTSQFLARPVLDTHGWDHDCGYDGVNVEQSLAIASRFPTAVTIQITKDKKDFSINLDSSVSAKHGENGSSMAGFDIQSIGKQLAYIFRGETKFKNLKKNKTAGGISVTFLGENIVTGAKIEDQITFGKQYVLVGSAGTVRSQHDTAYGANFELQRREKDYPIGQVQSTLSMSVIKWRGDLAVGLNSLAQFSIGRNSKVAVRAGINNKLSGQITVRTSSSEHLSLALAAILPAALSVYKKLWPAAGERYPIY